MGLLDPSQTQWEEFLKITYQYLTSTNYAYHYYQMIKRELEIINQIIPTTILNILSILNKNYCIADWEKKIVLCSFTVGLIFLLVKGLIKWVASIAYWFLTLAEIRNRSRNRLNKK
jgi:hypothetical protein